MRGVSNLQYNRSFVFYLKCMLVCVHVLFMIKVLSYFRYGGSATMSLLACGARRNRHIFIYLY